MNRRPLSGSDGLMKARLLLSWHWLNEAWAVDFVFTYYAFAHDCERNQYFFTSDVHRFEAAQRPEVMLFCR